MRTRCRGRAPIERERVPCMPASSAQPSSCGEGSSCCCGDAAGARAVLTPGQRSTRAHANRSVGGELRRRRVIAAIRYMRACCVEGAARILSSAGCGGSSGAACGMRVHTMPVLRLISAHACSAAPSASQRGEFGGASRAARVQARAHVAAPSRLIAPASLHSWVQWVQLRHSECCAARLTNSLIDPSSSRPQPPLLLPISVQAVAQAVGL